MMVPNIVGKKYLPENKVFTICIHKPFSGYTIYLINFQSINQLKESQKY